MDHVSGNGVNTEGCPLVRVDKLGQKIWAKWPVSMLYNSVILGPRTLTEFTFIVVLAVSNLFSRRISTRVSNIQVAIIGVK